MKTIRMLTDCVGGNGEPLAADKIYDLEDASAQHWLKRNKAVEVSTEEAAGVDGVEADSEGDGSEGVEDEGASGMTVVEIKEALTAAGIEIPKGAKKAELVTLLESLGGK